jgi:hypothetical protein
MGIEKEKAFFIIQDCLDAIKANEDNLKNEDYIDEIIQQAITLKSLLADARYKKSIFYKG